MFPSDERGEAAVLEMTLILPLISLIVSALMIFGIRLADRSVMQARVEKTAAEAALYYTVPGYEYISGEEMDEISAGDVSLLYSEKDPYRYLWGFEGTDVLENEAAQTLSACSLVVCSQPDVGIEIRTDLRGDFVCVTAEKEYVNFLPWIPDTVSVSAIARLNDADETVRNTDLVSYLFDYGEKLIKERGGIGKLLSDIGIE